MSDRVLLRPLSEVDWRLLRELRLRALADAPDSFGPTLDSALAHPESYWRGWAGGRSGRVRAWVAFLEGEPVGLVSGGIRSGDHSSEMVGHLGALWLDPAHRGTGLGRRLTETACSWLESRGCARIELEVTEGNPAGRLYRSLGFAPTGARQPLRDGSLLLELTMARDRQPAPPSAGQSAR